MRRILVPSPGFFTTVQDLGREGYGPMGVSASGAADAISLRLGNRLVGNPENAASLEMTLLGGTFEFPEGARLALSGSDFGAWLDGVPVQFWKSFEAQAGQALRVGFTRDGARCYLAVQGGISVSYFLGSASTHVLSGLGGLEGRALRKGDVLSIGDSNGDFRPRAISGAGLRQLVPRKVLRLTDGPQLSWFPESARRTFFEGTYRVAEESNRTGIRLEGSPVLTNSGQEMVSEGVSLGAIQIPPGGQPIIVFVEQQTTGGYLKIANLITADVHSAGQLRPRDEIRFERVEMDVARALLREQEDLLASTELIEE